MSEPEQTASQAIRETAWQQALALYKQWEQSYDRAFGGTGGSGYRDPFARAEVGRLRAMLDAVIVAHNFQGTRADPMLNWADRRTASWDCPPMTEACEHSSSTGVDQYFGPGKVMACDSCGAQESVDW